MKEMSSVFNISTNFFHCFEQVKLSYNQNKDKQVCRVETYPWTKVIPLSRISTNMLTFVQIPWHLNISNAQLINVCSKISKTYVRNKFLFQTLTWNVFQMFDQILPMLIFSIKTCSCQKEVTKHSEMNLKISAVHGQSNIIYFKFSWCIIQLTEYVEGHEIPNQINEFHYTLMHGSHWCSMYLVRKFDFPPITLWSPREHFTLLKIQENL